MTGVPFMGSEVGAFIPSDSNATETTDTTLFDSAFCRACLMISGNSSYHDSAAIQNLTDAWCRFDMRVGGNTYNVTNDVFLWLTGAGGSGIKLTWNRQTYVLTLYRWNSSWVAAGSTIVLDMVSARQTIHVHAIVNSASGSIDVYVGGTVRIQSGTIDLSGIANLNKVRFFGMTYSVIAIPVYVSEVIVDDETTIGRRVMTVVMTGNGASTAFTGDYTAIDEGVYSDTDTINGVTNGDIELYTGTPVGTIPLTGYRIKGIAITGRTKKSGVGPAQMRFKLRSAGSNYDGTTLAQDFGYGAWFHSWELNPATTAAFLTSETTALQYGQEAIT